MQFYVLLQRQILWLGKADVKGHEAGEPGQFFVKEGSVLLLNIMAIKIDGS